MKLTLLDMTQRILSSMDSDSVNSIDDTIEALQVAEIVRECYEDLITQRDWEFLKQLTQLTGLGDVNNPTKMGIPEGVNKIKWVKYNKKNVTYLDPKEFKDLIDNRTAQTGVVNSQGYIINADPVYWTSYDDNFIWFDGIDLSVDTTLQQSKSAAHCVMVPNWDHEDNFVPLLPEKMFPTLLADAKGTAWLQLKQQVNEKEEAKARRGKARHQNEAKRLEANEHTTAGVDYGRR